MFLTLLADPAVKTRRVTFPADKHFPNALYVVLIFVYFVDFWDTNKRQFLIKLLIYRRVI
jgi:hypothetical protein